MAQLKVWQENFNILGEINRFFLPLSRFSGGNFFHLSEKFSCAHILQSGHVGHVRKLASVRAFYVQVCSVQVRPGKSYGRFGQQDWTKKVPENAINQW